MPDADALRRAVDELTLRDHFASVALAALVEGGMKEDLAAKQAYDYAEAMLAERTARADAD
jgi:hypothetical protein